MGQKPKNRNIRNTGDQIETLHSIGHRTAFHAIVENCASIIIQSQARRFLRRSPRSRIMVTDEANKIIVEPTETRMDNDTCNTEEVIPDSFDTLLSYCYSMGVRVSALEVVGLMKAMELLTIREYENVIFALNTLEKEHLNFAPEPQYRLRIFSNEDLFKSDLYHAWNLIHERVRRNVETIKLASRSVKSIFSVIQQNSRIPIEAVHLLRNNKYDAVSVQYFLRYIGVEWKKGDKFSLLQTLQELNQMKSIDLSLKLRLRTVFQFMKVLAHLNRSMSCDNDLNEVLCQSFWKIVQLEEDLDVISKTLNNTRVALTATKVKVETSETLPVAESKPLIVNRAYGAKLRKTEVGSRTKEEPTCVDRRAFPKVSTVDIVFGSDLQDCNYSSKHASTVEVRNRRVKKNVSKPKKSLCNMARTSQNKRAAGEKISSGKGMASSTIDKSKGNDIYEMANEKLNLMLEKLNSRLGGT
jgi:hypothetical protein